MATTARPFEILLSGVRDSTGAAVASGKVRWYSPGTLTPATAYTDAACATPATAPLTLSAGGTGTLYFLEPVRVIIKDSTESSTYYDGIASLNRHDSIYVTHPSFNGGAETTLENILTSFGTNLGTDGNYLESAGATARSYATWLGQFAVSVKDFGAVGDGTTSDQTAIQAAYDRVKARGGGWVYWPVGTYKITSPISIDTAGVNTMGAGRTAIVKNFGTTTNAFTVNLGSAIDSKMIFRDLAITANTTSSGVGIAVTNGTKTVIDRVSVGLHRSGISVGASAILSHVLIESTDDNASGVGIAIGQRGHIRDSEIVCGTTNGTGISSTATDVRVTDCYINKFTTGVNCLGAGTLIKGGTIAASTTGVLASAAETMVIDATFDTCPTAVNLATARSFVKGLTIVSSTTGVTFGAANTAARDCVTRSCTTGFSVGAFAGVAIIGCVGSSNTTDLAVNASATGLIEHSNTFTTLSDSATTPHSWMKDRGKVLKITKATDSTTSPAFTPTPQSCDVYVCAMTSAGAFGSITINATATTGLVDGQLFTIVLYRSGGTNNPPPAWAGQYGNFQTPTTGNLAATQTMVVPLVWRSAISCWVLNAPALAAGIALGNSWQ